MEENKLTDEEIVKVLDECFAKVGVMRCGECKVYTGEGLRDCMKHVGRLALDLIHRLQGENKGKTEHLEKCLDEIDRLKTANAEQKAEIERLTEELDLANETIDRNNKRYERVSIERQKALDRVDYLEDALLDKIRRNEELITAIKQAEQQAEKDTANKVYKGLCERKNWDDMKDAILWGNESEELKALISKIVGVEVE